MGDTRLCYGCMETITDVQICPECGYDRNFTNAEPYLAAGTVLRDRYIVGKLLRHNGESADYIAYDKTISCKAIVKEYMPENLCERDRNGTQINENHNQKVQYKALMDDFGELNRSIAKMRSINHIIPINDMFMDNNTSYVIFEYIEGTSLFEFLKENAGELTWEQVSKLFPPLFTTLSLIHNAGMVHRGISPETIIVTKKGELRLTNFSISVLRTANTEINSELFHGYTAPEQYSLSGWQGTWTDVYGISAVLYRTLTGCRPAEAQTRISNDTLCPPCEINSNISKKVSDTIMEGLAVRSEDRIQTVTELVTKLFEENGESEKINRTNTATISISKQYAEPKVQRPRPKRDERVAAVEKVSDAETISTLDRIKVPFMIGVLLAAILLVIGIICMAFFSGGGEGYIDPSMYGNNSSYFDNVIEVTATGGEAVTSNVGDSDMPQLVGYKYDEISESSTFLGWFVIEPEYEFNDKVERGIITHQSIQPGEKFASGSTVKVTVSQGPAKVEIPDFMLTSYSSYKYEAYFEMLDDLGISYDPKPEINWGYADGYVIGISIKGERVRGGDIINLKGGEVLEVRYTDNYNTSNIQTNYYAATEEDDDNNTTSVKYVVTKAYVWTTAAPVITQAPPVTQPPVTKAPETQPPPATQPPPVVTQAPPDPDPEPIPDPVPDPAPEPPVNEGGNDAE